MKRLKNKKYPFLRIGGEIKSTKIGFRFRLDLALMMCACIFFHQTLFAEERLTIGVAANFMLPFQEISLAFENKHDIKINATYTSTGNLYGQIIHGAPYDLFLAADERRPERLLKEGLTHSTFVYARGRAVLWTAKKQICEVKEWQEALMMQGISKISIANPETAPYGSAALQALKKVGLEEIVTKKLVFAQNVVQSFQYAHTESVDVGFCALSSVFSEQGKKGCYFLIDQAPVIIQRACIITGSGKRKLAEKFAAFLSSPDAQNIKTKFGYN